MLIATNTQMSPLNYINFLSIRLSLLSFSLQYAYSPGTQSVLITSQTPHPNTQSHTHIRPKSPQCQNASTTPAPLTSLSSHPSHHPAAKHAPHQRSTTRTSRAWILEISS
jgi:hypothetical protein